MPKLLLVVLLAPLLLVAAVLLAPFATCYFLFDRLCDLIEEFKPQKSRRGRKKQPGRAAQLGRILSLFPNRANNDNGRFTQAA